MHVFLVIEMICLNTKSRWPVHEPQRDIVLGLLFEFYFSRPCNIQLIALLIKFVRRQS